MKAKFAIYIVILFFICNCYSLSVQGTGQMGDKIIIGKDTLQLLACPIERDSLLSTELHKHLSGHFSTGCWRGYEAVWYLENDTLFLDQIEDYCSIYSDSTVLIDTKGIFDIYEKNGKIAATWFSGELRVAKGNEIYYQHDGFHRFYEEEWIYRIKEGKVLSFTFYNNHLKKAKLPLEHMPYFLSTLFNTQKLPELEEKNIFFDIKVWPKQNGRIDSLSISLYTPSDRNRIENNYSHPYICEIKRCLEYVPDWDYLFVHDKVKPVEFNMRLIKKKDMSKYEERNYLKQKADTLVLNDSVYIMKQFPLNRNMDLFSGLLPFFKETFIPNCLRGYTARWEIENKELFLKLLYDGENNNKIPLHSLFTNELENSVKASWYSEQLQISSEETLGKSYTLSKIPAKEIFLDMENGKVVGETTYNNYFQPGDENALVKRDKIICAFEWNNYPELDDKSLHASYTVYPDLNGRAKSIDVAIYINRQRNREKNIERYHREITDPSDPFMKIIKTALEQVSKWDVLYIRGEVQPIESRIYIKKENK